MTLLIDKNTKRIVVKGCSKSEAKSNQVDLDDSHEVENAPVGFKFDSLSSYKNEEMIYVEFLFDNGGELVRGFSSISISSFKLLTDYVALTGKQFLTFEEHAYSPMNFGRFFMDKSNVQFTTNEDFYKEQVEKLSKGPIAKRVTTGDYVELTRTNVPYLYIGKVFAQKLGSFDKMSPTQIHVVKSDEGTYFTYLTAEFNRAFQVSSRKADVEQAQEFIDYCKNITDKDINDLIFEAYAEHVALPLSRRHHNVNVSRELDIAMKFQGWPTAKINYKGIIASHATSRMVIDPETGKLKSKYIVRSLDLSDK